LKSPDAAALGAVLAAALAPALAAALGAAGEGVAEPPQAAATIASAPSSARPRSLKLIEIDPPVSRTARRSPRARSS
jgi:hypothetical protein